MDIESKFTVGALLLAILAGFAWALGGKAADKLVTSKLPTGEPVGSNPIPPMGATPLGNNPIGVTGEGSAVALPDVNAPGLGTTFGAVKTGPQYPYNPYTNPGGYSSTPNIIQ